jgi:flagellin
LNGLRELRTECALRDLGRGIPITIGLNIFAQRAPRQLASLFDAIGTSFERFSSGQRINRASDDAAGLAISDSLRSNARTYAIAARNINDGVSLLNVVQSVLQTQKFILGRLSEIAEQSAHGVYSADQRAALQEEYPSLLAEYGRTADAASFNGRSVAKGSRGGVTSLSIQAGIDGSVHSLLQVPAEDLGLFSRTLVVTGDLTTTGQNHGIPDEFSTGALPSSDGRTSAVAFAGVESADRALAARAVIAARRNELSQAEGRPGAVQSRLESAFAVGFSARENSLAAESRIRDINVASENRENARLTILPHAAASVLGQAN